MNTTLTLADLPIPPEEKVGWPWTEPPHLLPEKMENGKAWPRISIITPSYNYGHFIEATIRSVLLQGYPNLEYIVIDGGSTDNTPQILQKYDQFISFWKSESDQGQTDAINKGHAKCTGDIFVWLNADDIYNQKNCLEQIANLYGQGYELIIGECLNVNNDDIPIEITPLFNGYAPPQKFDQYVKFWSFVPLPQPAVFVTTKLTKIAFPLRTDIHINMDYQLFLRVLGQHPKSIWVKQKWVKFKYHGENKTLTSNVNSYLEFYTIATTEAENHYPYVRSKLFKISATDYLIITSIIGAAKFIPKELILALMSRPTLGRWPIFWKLLIRSFVGIKKYNLLKTILK